MKGSSPVQACAVIADSSVESYRASLTEAGALNISHQHSATELESGLRSVLIAAELRLTSDERTRLICDLLTEATSRLRDTLSPKTEASSSKSSSAIPTSSLDSSSSVTISTEPHGVVTLTGLSPSDVSALLEFCLSRGVKYNAKK